ncbi:MAG: RsmB/NOP family class I SAM-dependent RNA methyltransferase [Proteobacteria bacterium]|nr:RsmB/NOP family class I SAM-dependent RNA methyltransferase [Pseudomonadota bacterium]
MKPAAREAAAIEILDRWREGRAVEAALTAWGRASRFAGSGDREAVRDLVFGAVRRFRSAAALGGGSTGRALLLGLARAEGRLPEGWTGEGHAPVPLTMAEAALMEAPLPRLTRGEALDCPDWLLPAFDAALGQDADPVLALMRDRAPVFLRVNRGRASRGAVIAELAEAGIEARTHPLAETALEVTAGARKLRTSAALAEGRVELQDAASQAVALDFAAVASGPVLDYCAGGGGKALALAAEGFAVTAHDAEPRRMGDLPVRAGRAGARIEVLAGEASGLWPAVLADAPCSGSGSWRRAPEAKWAFTPERLVALNAVQTQILEACAALTAPGGVLGYATCSMLRAENEDRIAAFLAAQPGWRLMAERRLTPLDGGDGFYLALLRRE